MIDATSKQVIAHVCSQQCGYALIGMPKRAAEDDAGQEETPHERAIKTASNVAKLAMILDRIASIEEDMQKSLDAEDSNERISILTRLQIRIDAGITSSSSVLEKLVEIRDYLINELQNAARGFDVDYGAIQSRITSLTNQLADDETLGRYLYMHGPLSLRNLLPMDAQRIIARRTFPIQVVSDFHTPFAPSIVFAACAETHSIYLFFKENNMLRMKIYHPNGEKMEDFLNTYTFNLLNVNPATLLVASGANYWQLQNARLLNGRIFALTTTGSWCIIPETDSVFFSDYISLTPQPFNNNASKGLVQLLTVPTVWKDRRVAHCFVRNNIVAIVDRSNQVRIFDLQNDTQTTLTSVRLRAIDSVAIDDKSNIWISHGTSLAVFTLAGDEITIDDLTKHVPFNVSPHDPFQPSLLTAAGSLVWLVYQVHSFTDQHIVQVLGLRLTPEILLA